MFSKTSLNVLVLVQLNCFQKMVYIVAKPVVVFFSQMDSRGSVKIHNVFHLDITKLAILRFKIRASKLADCWRVEAHIRSLPLPIGQTINAPENERRRPRSTNPGSRPLFLLGTNFKPTGHSTRVSPLRVRQFTNAFVSGDQWFFLGWILQIFYFKNGIPSLLQIRFFF
jgi:hypothetical protein